MNTVTLPALIAVAGESAQFRLVEFFTANIRNPHTRRAYARAVNEFLTWCHAMDVPDLVAVGPLPDYGERVTPLF